MGKQPRLVRTAPNSPPHPQHWAVFLGPACFWEEADNRVLPTVLWREGSGPVHPSIPGILRWFSSPLLFSPPGFLVV